jgi:hypothetical protein
MREVDTKKPERRIASTHFVVEAAMDASHGDKKTPWAHAMPRNIATWGEVADTERRDGGK